MTTMKRNSNGLLILALLCFCFNSSASLKIASYNIRTFDSKRSPTDKVELKKILTNLKAHLISVQEIVNAGSFKSFVKRELPQYGYYIGSCGGNGGQKLGFLYLKDQFKIENIYEDHRLGHIKGISQSKKCGSLRSALVGIFTHLKTNQKLVVLGVHLKAGSSSQNIRRRARQYRVVTDMVDEFKKRRFKNIIILGDFNTTGYISRDFDYDNFQKMLVNTSMLSSSENLECSAYWMGKNRTDDIEEPSMLDHIIHSSSLLGLSKKKVAIYSHCKRVLCRIEKKASLGRSYLNVSDHCPVSITFD